jgi:hypothetical protein
MTAERNAVCAHTGTVESINRPANRLPRPPFDRDLIEILLPAALDEGGHAGLKPSVFPPLAMRARLIRTILA